jgi:hypothetical protein
MLCSLNILFNHPVSEATPNSKITGAYCAYHLRTACVENNSSNAVRRDCRSLAEAAIRTEDVVATGGQIQRRETKLTEAKPTEAIAGAKKEGCHLFGIIVSWLASLQLTKRCRLSWLTNSALALRLFIIYLSYIYLGSSVSHIPVIFLSSCHIPVCRCCGTLSYSLCFSHQTDQGDETEGL